MTDKKMTISLAMTGASGAQYGLRLLEVLLKQGHRVYLMLSRPAVVVINMDTDIKLPSQPKAIQNFFEERYGAEKGQLFVFGKNDWMAPVASGSGAADAMIVCPCTAGTLAAMAGGMADSLIRRSADVALKERKPLIVVMRETPYAMIHLENMLTLTRAGAVIMPSNPGFYNRPKTLEEVYDFMVAKILDQLNIEHDLMPKWGHDRIENFEPEDEL